MVIAPEPTIPRTWASFETAAVEMLQFHAGHMDGIGFAFSAENDPFCGIDLDRIWLSDADEGASPWAMRILEQFADTYSEVSPSDSGVKIWCARRRRRLALRSWPIEHGASSRSTITRDTSPSPGDLAESIRTITVITRRMSSYSSPTWTTIIPIIPKASGRRVSTPRSPTARNTTRW